MKSWHRIASHSLLLFLMIFAALSFSAQGGLWINKISETSICAEGEVVNYNISYGYDGIRSANNVLIEDILPNVDLISASPAPSSQSGNILRWNIGELKSGEGEPIQVSVRVRHVRNITFDESSSVSGDGFVNVRKSLSASGYEGPVLVNTAIIYENNRPVSSSTCTIAIQGELGTDLKSAEHGSGSYSEEEISNLNTTADTIILAKDISATYKPTTFHLPENRTVSFSSTWSDLTSIKNPHTGDSFAENYQYMDDLKKSGGYNNHSQDLYSSQSNFSGGIASIGYVKQEPHTPGTKTTRLEISETYHGDFQTEQSLNAGSYSKYAKGTGFASSDANMGCDLRSSEHGSGSYESELQLSSNTILKSSNMVYQHNDQSVGGLNISYNNKWSEFSYVRNPSQSSEILQRISSADYIQQETLVGPSFLGTTGRFNGTEYFRGKFNGIDKAEVERMLIGNYNLDTTFAMSNVAKYLYPHLNLTKMVVANDGNYITYLINITNDGNEILSPVQVVDVLPEGTSFYSSSMQPVVQGRVVSWSFLALTIGDIQSIESIVKLDYEGADMLNRVQAVAQYGNRTILTEASSSPVVDAIPQYNTTTISDTGAWRPPSCFDLGLNLSECDGAIQRYYSGRDDNTGGCCPKITNVLW